MEVISRSSFNFEDLVDFVDFSSLRFLLTSLSGNKIAIATSRYLIIVEDNYRLEQKQVNKNFADYSDDERLQTVVEFGEISGRPTAICWITVDIVCVGFESGGLSCFNLFGDTITEIEFANSPVVAIHTCLGQGKASEIEVWALYENKFIVSISLSHLLSSTGALARYYLKFKLMDQDAVLDFVVLPEPYSMSIFDAEMNSPNNSFVVVGVEPSLSLYNIGGKQHFQHLGKLASYVRERVSSAISKTVSNALVSFFGSGGSQEAAPEQDYTPITSSLDFVESTKRRILRVSLDPTGKLLAAADTLGRVLLFDMRYVSAVLRVWKGVREARFAWTMDLAPACCTGTGTGTGSGSGSGGHADVACGGSSAGPALRSYQLSLAIYAPQLGLLSLYQVRHGPCLRSIPVGPQCQIFTIQEVLPSGETIAKCALLRNYADSPLLHLCLVSPFDHADDDIDLNELQAQAEAVKSSHDEEGEEEEEPAALRSDLQAGSGGAAKLTDLLIPHFARLSPFPPPHHPHPLSHVSANRGTDATPDSSSAGVREKCIRFILKLEKLLKQALMLLEVSAGKSSPPAESGGGPEDSSEHSMTNLEHKIWMMLSSPSAHTLFLSSLSTFVYDGEGMAMLLHCLTLIERVEVTMYTRQAYMEHAHSPSSASHGASGKNKSHNGNSNECGMIYFSLQFHRNLCRLLEEVGASSMASVSLPDGSAAATRRAVLVQYAQNRSKLVKAYTMLIDINAHLSLSQMTVQAAQLPPLEALIDQTTSGRRSSKDPSSPGPGPAATAATSDQEASLRAEAISWAARFLRPHYATLPLGSKAPAPRHSDALSVDTSGHLDVFTAAPRVEPIICHQNPLSFFHAPCPVSFPESGSSGGNRCGGSRFAPLPSVPLQARTVAFSAHLATQYADISKQPASSIFPSASSATPSITAAVRCPEAPAVFQPAAIGRYIPFAVFLCFHEKPNTRISLWREHVELVNGVITPAEDRQNDYDSDSSCSSSDVSESNSDSGSEEEDPEASEARRQEKEAHRCLKKFEKLTSLAFRFRAFTSLVDASSRNMNGSLWHGGGTGSNSNSASSSSSSSGGVDDRDNAEASPSSDSAAAVAVASDLPAWVGRELLTFLCLPLLGDVFSVQTVITAFDMMGLGGSGLGLVRTLPMVMLFLESQPLSLLYQHLVSKPLSASPIQRWLRDTLLQFQSHMASDVEGEEEGTGGGGGGGGGGDFLSDLTGESDAGIYERRFRASRKKKELMDLLTAVIASRSVPEAGGLGEDREDGDLSRDSEVLIKQTPVPSLDEVVRHLFRPAWLLARRSCHLEFAFMLVAQVSEVLDTISEQLERRTFGEMSLKGTNCAWHVVAKQLRVTLLISSRTGGCVSVEALGTGDISLFTLLATDTLCFAMQPEQAVEHELRCQEVYNRRAGKEEVSKVAPASSSGGKKKSSDGNAGMGGGSSSGSSSSSSGSGGSALLAWGLSADSRWRELISIADMEDQVLQETAVATPLMIATSALLAELDQMAVQLTQVLALSQPSAPVPAINPSSTSNFSPSSASLVLSTTGTSRSSSRSNSPLPLARSARSTPAAPAERPAKESKKIRRRRPLLLFFPTHNQPVPLAAYRACALADRWKRRPKRLEMLTLAGAHLFPLPPVTRAAVAEHILLTTVFPLMREYLQIEEGERLQPASPTKATTPSRGFFNSKSTSSFGGDKNSRVVEAQELVAIMADAEMVEQFVRACQELLGVTLQSFDDFSQPSVDVAAGSRHRSHTISSVCHDDYNYMSALAFKDEASELISWPITQDAKLSALVRQFREKRGTFEGAVRQHMALLGALQLRTQCGLRGVKLVELFGTPFLRAFAQNNSLNHPPPSSVNARSTEDPAPALPFSSHVLLQQSRLEAIRGKVSNGSSKEKEEEARFSQVHRLREEFLMQCFRRLETQPTALVYVIAGIWGFEARATRLGHLQIVLQLGLDEVAEELIGHIDDPSLVMDCVIQGVRHRVGSCLATMERIQVCGPLLASFDPDYYTWAREVAPPPEHQELEEVVKGRRKVVAFDVPASRHLLIRVQALLLLVPQARRLDQWKQRKADCDALLALCSSLAPAEIQSALKNSGLKTT